MVQEKLDIKPTEAELTLLNILWKMGPATVRQIHEAVSLSQKTGYTTVLKILQIMHEKTEQFNNLTEQIKISRFVVWNQKSFYSQIVLILFFYYYCSKRVINYILSM